MSLINDALKRASGPTPPRSATLSGGPMQPMVEEPPRPGNPALYGIAALAALLVIAVGGAMLKSKTASLQEESPAANAAAAVPVVEPYPIGGAEPAAGAAPAPAVRLAAKTVISPQAGEAAAPSRSVGAPVPAPGEAVRIEQPAAVAVAAAPVKAAAVNAPRAVAAAPAQAAGQPAKAAVAAASSNAFPDLKLQAIYYRLKGPTVVIDGRTVRVGQSIGGAKLTAIHRYGAEVEHKGKSRFLTLE